jgi:UDP-N-acetyl-D-mannosaminuronic acid dehydrogenase
MGDDSESSFSGLLEVMPIKPKIDVVVVGAGYVGLTLAIHFASKGLNVVAVDNDREKTRRLGKGETTLVEPGIAEVLREVISSGHLRFTTKLEAGASNWILAIPYFPGKPGLFVKVLDMIEGDGETPPLVVARSTVPIGFSRDFILPRLEEKYNGKLDEAFYLVSCPERTLSGAALEELSTLPQLIGGSEKSAERAAQLFERAGIVSLKLPLLEGGELAKVFANFARLVEFNLANFLAVLCHIYGVSEETMIKTITSGYGRLNFLKQPGLGVGGFCLPKDSLILQEALDVLGHETFILPGIAAYPKSEYELNQSVIRYHLDRILKLTEGRRNILACGIAFKGVPKTDDTRSSVGLTIVRELIRQGRVVEVSDLSVSPDKVESLGLVRAVEPIDVSSFDAVLLLNNDPDYRNLFCTSQPAEAGQSIALYDPWRLLVIGKESIFQDRLPLETIKKRLN